MDLNKKEEILRKWLERYALKMSNIAHGTTVVPHLLHSAMEEYAIMARIQERKDCISVLGQDLLDNGPEGEGIYSEDYRRCINDEIANHKSFIEDLEKELLGLQ